VGPYFLDCRFIGEPSDDMYHEIYEDLDNCVGRMGALCGYLGVRYCLDC
jgi:hypothetical protein